MTINQKLRDIFSKEVGIDQHEIRKSVVDLYNSEFATKYDSINLKVSEDLEIIKWISQNDFILEFSKNPIVIKKVKWYINETQKVSMLSQTRCHICTLVSSRTFPIRLKPHTYQTNNSELKRNIIKGISDSPYGADVFPKGSKLCVRLIFIMKLHPKDKDLDNMAKITLDGLKQKWNLDDKDIDHLDLVKIKTTYLEDFIKVRVAISDINNHDDIIFNHPNIDFPGLDKIIPRSQ